jgi:quercetin dioxygenase-like cupin family protein
VVVIDGGVEFSAAGTDRPAGPGTLAVFAPQERHEVRALSDARLLLLLAPWPGDGHPGSPG